MRESWKNKDAKPPRGTETHTKSLAATRVLGCDTRSSGARLLHGAAVAAYLFLLAASLPTTIGEIKPIARGKQDLEIRKWSPLSACAS